MEFFQRSLFQAQPNASALESECKSRTKYHYHQTHNKLFYAKTKIIPEMAKFDMWKWQNQRKYGRKQAKKWKENSMRVRLFIAQNPRSPPKVQYATTQNLLAASRNRKLISAAALEPRK